MTSDSTIVTSEQHLYQTIVQFDKTIVLSRKLATGNIHDYLFCYSPLVVILFAVLRIGTSARCLFLVVLYFAANLSNTPGFVLHIVSDYYGSVYRLRAMFG